jgi:UDP-N-acetylglucosamine/UDP-N-acetylgalactosamine diphosphorylase
MGGEPPTERLAAAGQEHLLRFFDDLGEEEREHLLAEIADLDLPLIERLLATSDEDEKAVPSLEPIPAIHPDDPDREAATEAGRELFREGKVAFYTVAGGQGTRLGFDGPKGCFPVGPATGKTLFRWHAEKVYAAGAHHGHPVPWVVMVSDANEETTRRFFEENGWFEMKDRIRFVRQRSLPAVDDEGRILLSTRSSLALSPNGHGGSIAALFEDGTADWLREQGVEVISYFQVDNPLLNAADLAFLGYHVRREADMSAKVVEKVDPAERVGIVALVDGRPGIVEYTELPEDLAAARDEEGRLSYRMANIAAHVFSLDFLDRIRDRGLEYHVARKAVPTLDEDGAPTTVTGRKFEMFVFDAIPLADGFNVFVTDRAEEFAPLKNAEGDDSPDTVREALLERTRRWYYTAGRSIPVAEGALELSPLQAYDYATFQWYLHRGEE